MSGYDLNQFDKSNKNKIADHKMAQISISISQDEKERLKFAQDRGGFNTLAGYIRHKMKQANII